MALQPLHVRIDHQPDQLLEADGWLPPQLAPRLAGVAEEMVYLSRPVERFVDHDVVPVVEADMPERDVTELPHRMVDARRDDVVGGGRLLEHGPHGADVVAGETPVPARLEVPHPEVLGQPESDAGGSVCDLA